MEPPLCVSRLVPGAGVCLIGRQSACWFFGSLQRSVNLSRETYADRRRGDKNQDREQPAQKRDARQKIHQEERDEDGSRVDTEDFQPFAFRHLQTGLEGY